MKIKNLLPLSLLLLTAPPAIANGEPPNTSQTQSTPAAQDPATATRLTELNHFWHTVSQSVKTGDFAAYKAACHPAAILVSEAQKTTQPMTTALTRWKPGFDDTKAARATASVEFRLSQRIGDPTTAHETGIFLYTFTGPDGQTKKSYIHFEALLTKTSPSSPNTPTPSWQILMEYQKTPATAAEWNALPPLP